MSFKVEQASDNVVLSILDKHNSRVKSYPTYRKKPLFTREYGNLLGITKFRLSGFRNKSVNVGKRTFKKGDKKHRSFGIVIKNQDKLQNPRNYYTTKELVGNDKDSLLVDIKNDTAYKYYRGDLSKYAQQRLWQIKKNNYQYKKKLKKENIGNEKEKVVKKDKKTEKKQGGDDIELVD